MSQGAPHQAMGLQIPRPPAAPILAGPGGLSVVLGRSGASVLAGDDGAPRERALRAVAEARRDFDVIVLDTGAGVGPATLMAAERADLVLGVTTPDIASVTDAYALCKVLHGRGRPMPAMLVNRVASRDEAMRTAAKLAAVVRQFLGSELRTCGYVREDAAVPQALRDQRPLGLFGSGPAFDDLRAALAAALALMPTLARRAAAAPTPRVVPLRLGTDDLRGHGRSAAPATGSAPAPTTATGR
jgi:MinD-like ATPase involved in chromosome partitioning or flagellar assembly